MTEPLLEIAGLSVAYGGALALDGVSLSLAAGGVLALLGANGAGKSTLVRAVMGLVPLAAGSIRLDGMDLRGVATERRARLGLGYVPEGRRVFPGLSVADTLLLPSPCGAAERRRDLDRVYALFPALRTAAAQRAWRLSGGQQQMLAVGRALMLRPRLLLLDEPSLGLAPQVVEQLYAALAAVAADGTAVLLAEQQTPRALELAKGALAGRAILLRAGRVLYDGPAAVPPDLLRAAFLGG